MYIIHILYTYNFIKGKPHSTNTYLIKIDPITDGAVLALKAGWRVRFPVLWTFSVSRTPQKDPGTSLKGKCVRDCPASLIGYYARPGPGCGLFAQNGAAYRFRLHPRLVVPPGISLAAAGLSRSRDTLELIS